MIKLLPHTDEFYIGYASSSPKTVASFFKKLIGFGAAFFVIIATVLSFNQRDFATSEFEYGKYTSLSGVLVKSPVPHLRLPLGRNFLGQELFQSILLVGSGKCGIDNALDKFPESASINIKGFLIYGEGKALLQVNDIHDISIDRKGATNQTLSNELLATQKNISVMGEITDPKCYFGVMKPGEGKPHRSCAIRCIAGGIPAVLKANTSDYFLLLNENLRPLNSEVLSIVGDQVSVTGEMLELDDWKILKVDSRKIHLIAKSAEQKQKLLALDEAMTFCGH